MTELEGTIEIKLMEADEQEEFMDFLRGNLDTFDKFERVWKWRQDNKPISGGESAAIAKYNGKVVGCVGIVPAHISGFGDTVRACWQQDSLVAGTMRGRGVGKRLVEKAAEGWDLLLAKGTSLPMYGLRKSLGFLDARNSNYMVRVSRPRKFGFSAKRLVEYLLWIWRMIVVGPRIDDRISVCRVEEFDRSFDALAEGLKQKNVLKLHKDLRYLNWRYVSCPGKEYGIFKAGGDDARGAVVVATSRSDPEEGWIVDLICNRSDKQCGLSLIREGLQCLQVQGVSRIWAFSTLSSTRKWFMRFGFVPTKFTPRFTYRTVNKEIAEKIRVAEWDFWHGDGDLELYM